MENIAKGWIKCKALFFESEVSELNKLLNKEDVEWIPAL